MSISNDFTDAVTPGQPVVVPVSVPQAVPVPLPRAVPVPVPQSVPVAVPQGVPASVPKSAPAGEQADWSNPRIEYPGRTWVWDVPFDLATMRQSIDHIGRLIESGQPSYVITANLNYVMLHHQYEDLQPVTLDAAMVLADGQPIVWRSLLDTDPLPERVAGSEMIYELAQRASEHNWGIYFLGGEEGVAQSCADRLVELYPGLRVAGVESPPFRQLTDQEQAQQDKRIQQSNAQILLVAFGQPKGERWIYRNHKRLGVPVSIQLGASFDFVAGTAKRAPKVYQRLGMEWVYRMCGDPKRLVGRYVANAIFLAQALVRDWARKVDAWGYGI